MTDITIENIVAHAKIADDLDVMQIAEKLPEFNYNPDEFLGLTLKLDHLKTAILILPNGKVICTGAKSMDIVQTAVQEIVDKMTGIGIAVKKKPKLEMQNVVVSVNLQKEMDLESISTGLFLENVEYRPEQFPGLIYRMSNIGALLLIFSSGKIVCTGASNIEDATKAIEMLKVKLSSIGVL